MNYLVFKGDTNIDYLKRKWGKKFGQRMGCENGNLGPVYGHLAQLEQRRN